jgi:hypothetical protein
MTVKIGAVLLIESTPPTVCESCGQTAELRPYGPGGTNICVMCGLKDPVAFEERMVKAMKKALEGVTTVVAPNGMVCKLGHPVEEISSRKPE